MKNRFLNFLQKYWFCLLLSLIMVVGVSLSDYYAYLYEFGSDKIKFGLSTLYLVYVIPIYSLIYGCSSYVKIKKVWIPDLILYFTTCIYFLCTNLIIDKETDSWGNILIFSVYPVIFSFVGRGISALIYSIINSIKKKKK